VTESVTLGRMERVTLVFTPALTTTTSHIRHRPVPASFKQQMPAAIVWNSY